MFRMFSSFASEAVHDARKLARLYHFCVNKYKEKVEVSLIMLSEEKPEAKKTNCSGPDSEV